MIKKPSDECLEIALNEAKAKSIRSTLSLSSNYEPLRTEGWEVKFALGEIKFPRKCSTEDSNKKFTPNKSKEALDLFNQQIQMGKPIESNKNDDSKSK